MDEYKSFDDVVNEIKTISEQCIKCGMCRNSCPIFEVFLEEEYSPRSKNQIYADYVKSSDKTEYNKIVDRFVKLAYTCSLCNNCKVRCPLNLDLKELFRNFRYYLIKNGHEPKVHKDMIEKVRKYGNPFGDESVDDDQFYCC